MLSRFQEYIKNEFKVDKKVLDLAALAEKEAEDEFHKINEIKEKTVSEMTRPITWKGKLIIINTIPSVFLMTSSFKKISLRPFTLRIFKLYALAGLIIDASAKT